MSERAASTHRNMALTALIGVAGGALVVGIAPALRRADAADTVLSGPSTRMLALDATGRAIVIDQSNMAFLVDAATGRAVLILNDKNEPLRVR